MIWKKLFRVIAIPLHSMQKTGSIKLHTKVGTMKYPVLRPIHTEAKETDIFTARIRRMTEGNVFTLSTMRVPPSSLTGSGGLHPIQPHWVSIGYPPTQDGYPPPIGTGWGIPPPPRETEQNTVSSCYTAGGVSLAFTQ